MPKIEYRPILSTDDRTPALVPQCWWHTGVDANGQFIGWGGSGRTSDPVVLPFPCPFSMWDEKRPAIESNYFAAGSGGLEVLSETHARIKYDVEYAGSPDDTGGFLASFFPYMIRIRGPEQRIKLSVSADFGPAESSAYSFGFGGACLSLSPPNTEDINKAVFHSPDIGSGADEYLTVPWYRYFLNAYVYTHFQSYDIPGSSGNVTTATGWIQLDLELVV